MSGTNGSLALGLVLLLSACSEPELCMSQTGQPLIDGTLATSEDYPATAAVLVYAEAQGEVLAQLACSAVLIAPDVVLTAAHCVALYQFEDEPELPPVDLYVSFETDVSQFEKLGGPPPDTAIQVQAFTLHPAFSLERRAPREGLGALDDIALLFLSEPVTTIEPVPFFQAGPDLTAWSEVQIVGYGLVSVDDPEAGLGVKRHGSSQLFEVGANELRVGRALSADDPVAPGLADKCYGDSGGPTFVNVEGRPWLIGVTSRGYRAGAGCGVAGVDTRVDAYADWMARAADLACADGRRDPRSCAEFRVRGQTSGSGSDLVRPIDGVTGCEEED